MIHTAAIYDPYLDTLGGGERYCLTVAEILIKNGFQVDLFWSGDPELLKKAERRFSLNLKNLNIVPDIFNISPSKLDVVDNQQTIVKLTKAPSASQKIITKTRKLFHKFQNTRNYDLVFILSDGSVPLIFSKNSYLHIQVPFAHKPELIQTTSNLIKLKFYKNIICNSQFTQKFTQKLFPNSPTCVIYPPVDVEKFLSADKKDNVILSVGRFDNILNAKKQDVLIDSFKKLFPKIKPPKWKLILAGGSLSDQRNNAYLKLLQSQAKDYPIEFHVNPDFKTLSSLYSSSKIYWHAAGFGVDENREPQYTEHFGITIVEAMASGLVPIVINKGGLKEIVTNNTNGYLWANPDDLLRKTLRLINNPSKLKRLSQQCLSDAKQYSKENFEKKFLNLIKIK